MNNLNSTFNMLEADQRQIEESDADLSNFKGQKGKNGGPDSKSVSTTLNEFNKKNSTLLQNTNRRVRDPKEAPLVINVLYTQYEVLKDVGEEANFTLSYDEEEDWDVYWIDGAVSPAFLLKMQPYQRTNHFPGMIALARKNLLAKNL